MNLNANILSKAAVRLLALYTVKFSKKQYGTVRQCSLLHYVEAVLRKSVLVILLKSDAQEA